MRRGTSFFNMYRHLRHFYSHTINSIRVSYYSKVKVHSFNKIEAVQCISVFLYYVRTKRLHWWFWLCKLSVLWTKSSMHCVETRNEYMRGMSGVWCNHPKEGREPNCIVYVYIKGLTYNTHWSINVCFCFE